jgi:hypothetical protein
MRTEQPLGNVEEHMTHDEALDALSEIITRG